MVANYRLNQTQRYQEDYHDNRQTLNQRRQPTRRPTGNYRLDANGQPIMRPSQDYASGGRTGRSAPYRQPEQEPDVFYQEVLPSRAQRRQGNYRQAPTPPADRSGSVSRPGHQGAPRWPRGKMKLFSVFAGLVLGLTVVGYQLLPTHYVNAVQVVGNQRVDSQAIVEASGIQDWDRVKDVMSKRQTIEQDIMKANPLISKVTLRRPNMTNLEVEVEEHVIVAKIRTANGWLPVLDNGTWGEFSASVAQNESVDLAGLPEIMADAPSGKLTELTTMLKQTPQAILSQIESLQLVAGNKANAFEAQMRDGNLVKAVIPTFNYKMGFYDRMLAELGGKKGTLNLEVGAYFTPQSGQQRPVRIQSGQP